MTPRKCVTTRLSPPILSNMDRGFFITFEGGDGVGKSTQIARLAERLRALSICCEVTREPGGTPFAERVRAFILSGNLPPHVAMADAFLFAAARIDHVEARIRPAIETGAWVLCDRFSDLTRAYQGAAGGADTAALLQLEALAQGGCTPDLTLMLDLEPAAGRRRIAERNSNSDTASASGGGDPFEGRELAFQQRLRDLFLKIARQEPDRCRVVDAGQDADTIEREIWGLVTARFSLEVR